MWHNGGDLTRESFFKNLNLKKIKKLKKINFFKKNKS